MTALLWVSKYREAESDILFFDRLFDEFTKDILIDKIGYYVEAPFDREIFRFISKDEFSKINGKVVLSQESVARYFDFPVRTIADLISTLQSTGELHNDEIVKSGSKYWFPSVDAVLSLKPFSDYANVDINTTTLERAFDMSRAELQNQTVYYEKAANDKVPNLKSKKGCLIWLMIFALLGLLNDPKDKTPPPPPPGKVETQQPKVETPKVETQQPTQTFRDSGKLKGRGSDMISDLNYVGIQGFIAISFNEQYELIKNNSYLNTPWQVPTYERDKQFWVETGITLDHKTPIVVRQQFITQEKRYDPYEGYLLVERLSDGEKFYINVKHFITKPRWNSTDIADALDSYGLLVEYHQKSDYWPVSREDKKKVPPEGTILFATDTVGMLGKGWVQNSRHQIAAYNSDYGYIYFNKADLKIIY
ncbi:MAG: hypothetical protein IJU71_05680 [Selenomonadaceae bacterium]|nr:hypothetical protein [Selenomonadaceae bacterium]